MRESRDTIYQRASYESFDPDELAEVIAGTHLEHSLLPGGELRIEHQRLFMARGTLDCGAYDAGVHIRGAFARRTIVVGFGLEVSEPVALNGALVERHSLQLYAEGAEITYRSAPGTTWAALTIERGALQESARRLTGQPLSLPERESAFVDPTPEAGRRLAHAIRRTLAEGAHISRSTQDTVCVAGLEDALHTAFVEALQSTRSGLVGGGSPRNHGRRHAIMKSAEEYLRDNCSRPFSRSELAEATGTSIRMLNYYFRDLYGMTPQVWFRTMKLNRVREELLRRSRGDVRISDLAASWGFRHLGRFSVEYRRLFGERPSQTLRE